MNDLRQHIEDDLRTDAYPEIEGLRSARLSEQTYAQFDSQTGTLLIAGLDKQQLLESDEVARLVEFLRRLQMRHFTREDVEHEFLRIFSPCSEREAVRVTGVKLPAILGNTQPLWLVEGERQWGKNPPYRFSCVLSEYIMPDGAIRLVCATEVALPAGYLTPTEEDAEIERSRAESRALRMAAESAEPCSEVFLPGEEALHEEVQA